ncbi:CbtB domain-containing protein [Leptospira sp. SA-E8]|uniref:CbtB domain-containing protein n=1 Tax=Leptospira sp. SA-E8 TaxID=3422259 RepID=UPI003EBE59CF
MTQPTGLPHNAGHSAATPRSGAAVLRPLLAAAVLGVVVLYGVAFAASPMAHNAAHDVRHITVKPCH